MHQNNKCTPVSNDQNKDSQWPKYSLAQKHFHFPEIFIFFFVWKHFLISFGKETWNQVAKIHRIKRGEKTNYNSR